MKKQLLVSAAVMTAALAAPVIINIPVSAVTAYAQESESNITGQCGENASFVYDSTTGEMVITGTGSVGYGSWYGGYVFKEDIRNQVKSVVISEGITKIEVGTFRECTKLEYVKIPASVSDIGGYAFIECNSLKEIEVPEGVQNIGEQTFFKCTSLETVKLPDSMTSIGQYAFYNCKNLKVLNLPDSISNMGQCAFKGCESLTEIHLPASLGKLKKEMFQNCSSLVSIEFSDGITQIWSGAFSGCSSLKKVIIPDSVTVLDGATFYDCKSLEKVKLPDNIKKIDNYTFNNCESLTDVNIPDSVQSIGNGAFNNCKSLADVNIPDSVQSIGETAFYGCSSLKEIVIPQNITTIEKSTFGYCTSLEKVIMNEDGIISIGNGAFKSCYILKELTIPESVQSIGAEAFERTGLTSVVIPQGVTNIEEGTFWSCAHLEKVVVPDEGIISIGSYAFSYCNNLKDFTIPSSVQSVGSFAFAGAGLTSVVIPQGVTKIQNATFSDCLALEEVTIAEDSVTNIGYNAFANCESLRKITIPTSVSEIDSTAFSDDDKCVIYGYNGSFAEYYAKTYGITFSGAETSRHLNGWLVEDGVSYWYEYGVKQGTTNRGKEIYDSESDAWYWLDSVQGGAKTVSKDVYQKSAAGIWAEDLMTGKGKWVRYDENGHMVKGWQTTENGTYYFDLTYGTMAKGYATIDGVEYYFNKETGLLERTVGEAVEFGWKTIDGNAYWYENYNRQGCLRNEDSNYRGKEIYDPESDAWYWLDAQTDGSKAVSKDVYYIDYPAKWVRYDENGRMVKGWQTTENGTYYFDMITGKMAKGTVKIDDKEYVFDDVTGILQ